MDYYIEARQYFTIDEWINVLLSAIDYNPKGYVSKTQKMAMLSRLLPFVEKRINLIELAPKETGKSYCLAPAMEMRRVIKTQLGIIDEGEFGGMTIPEITIKEQYREK